MLYKDPKSPYVDYKYYTSSYHGSRISEKAFPYAELEAEAYINGITFGRVRRMDEVPECVKDAICSVAECAQSYMESHAANIRSESNDGYSVTYGDPIAATEYQDTMKQCAIRHLANTGLMYRGWSKVYDDQP